MDYRKSQLRARPPVSSGGQPVRVDGFSLVLFRVGEIAFWRDILQILPLRVSAHAAMVGAFSILRFPEPDLPDVVYVEHLTGALYVDKRSDVDAYTAVMSRLEVVSAPPHRTVAFLSRILTEVDGA